VTLDPHAGISRDEQLEKVREELTQVPGAAISVEQPLQHVIAQMLSGIKAQVGIKVYGDSLSVLRSKAQEIRAAIADVPGVRDLMVEPQIEIPQLHIELDRRALAANGLHADDINRLVETAMNGRVVSELLLGQRRYDLVVRLDDPFRQDPDALSGMPVDLPSGAQVPLNSVARIRDDSGPNVIHRDNSRRRIVVQCNTGGRDLGSVIADIQQRLGPLQSALPPGYLLEYGGQFQSQQSATRTIAVLSLVSLVGIVAALWALFGSLNLSLQVLAALPMAVIGAVAALVLTGQSLTVASMIGFISLGGIAARNGILLMAHYLHLLAEGEESFTPAMIERAGKERLAPMLMTAICTAIALVPIALSAGQPGKEILYPVATVILGGLISCSLLDFLVRPALFWLFGRSAVQHLLTPTKI